MQMQEPPLRRKSHRLATLGPLGVLLLLSAATTADDSVHILSKYGYQLLTSTTLKWLPMGHYTPTESKEIVVGGFEIALDAEGACARSLC